MNYLELFWCFLLSTRPFLPTFEGGWIFIWTSWLLVMYSQQYFNAMFLHSVSFFENIWLTTTFTFHWAFMNDFIPYFLHSATFQFTNWANINFGSWTLLLFWVISLSVPWCALLICISISLNVYGRLISDVKIQPIFLRYPPRFCLVFGLSSWTLG